MTRVRFEALIILCMVGFYIWEGLKIPAYYSLPGVPGPSIFPIILGVVMSAAAMWLLIFPGRSTGKEKALSAVPRLQDLLRDNWRFYLMWGLLIAYVFLLPILGFLISSIVLLAAFFFMLGEKRWHIGILIACVFSIGIYLLFARALQIKLPMVVLESVLKP